MQKVKSSAKIAKSPEATGNYKRLQTTVRLRGAVEVGNKVPEKIKKLLTEKDRCDNINKLSRKTTAENKKNLDN